MVAATMVLEEPVRTRWSTSTRWYLRRRRSSAASPAVPATASGATCDYAIAYIRDLLADYYIVGETYETTVPWSRITTSAMQ